MACILVVKWCPQCQWNALGSCENHMMMAWGSCEDHMMMAWGSCEDYMQCGSHTIVTHDWLIQMDCIYTAVWYTTTTSPVHRHFGWSESFDSNKLSVTTIHSWTTSITYYVPYRLQPSATTNGKHLLKCVCGEGCAFHVQCIQFTEEDDIISVIYIPLYLLGRHA